MCYNRDGQPSNCNMFMQPCEWLQSSEYGTEICVLSSK